MMMRALLAVAASGIVAAILFFAVRPRGAGEGMVDTSPASKPAAPAPDERPATTGVHEPTPFDGDPLRLPANRTADGVGHRILILDETGAPVAGAQVWFEGEPSFWTSEPDGSIRLPDWDSSGLVLAEGFSPRIVRASDAEKGLRLQRDHGVRLILMWEDGEPIRGAAVEAFYPQAGLEPARLARLAVPIAPTDADGGCLVRPHRFAGHTATLRIDPPGGPRTWVMLPSVLETRGTEQSHEVRLPRGNRGHRVRVVDAQGRPLADREVTLHRGVPETVITDPDGVAAFAARVGDVRTGDADVTGYAIDLDPAGTRWYVEHPGPPAEDEQVEVAVTPVDVHGRVLTTAPDSYVVASFALLGDERVQRGWPPGKKADVTWHPVRPDGTFGPLPGWQGPKILVAVRHRDFDVSLDHETVPADGGPVELEVPDMCRVSIEGKGLHRRDARMTWTERSVPELGESGTFMTIRSARTTILDVPIGGGVIQMQRARYTVLLELGGAPIDRFDVDATGPAATLDLSYPELVRFDVRISSSLRGPMAGLPMRFKTHLGSASRPARTDADGRIVLDFPALSTIQVAPVWGAGRIQDKSKELELDPDEPKAEFVIEEALLRIVESPPSPLLDAGKLWLEGTFAEDGGSTGKILAGLGDDRRREYLVAPGTYVVSRRFDARRVQEVEVTLAANEEREVVLDCSNLAALNASVTVADPGHSQLFFVARTEDGTLAALDSERRPGDFAWSVLEVVEPGLYQVEVESRDRGARSTAPPRDVWRGEVQAFSGGARQPLRIHLR